MAGRGGRGGMSGCFFSGRKNNVLSVRGLAEDGVPGLTKRFHDSWTRPARRVLVKNVLHKHVNDSEFAHVTVR